MAYWKNKNENTNRGIPDLWNDDQRNFRTPLRLDNMAPQWQNDQIDYVPRNGPPSLFSSRPNTLLSSSNQINSNIFESFQARNNIDMDSDNYNFRSSDNNYYNSPRSGRIMRNSLVDTSKARRILQKRALNAYGSGAFVSSRLKRKRLNKSQNTQSNEKSPKKENIKQEEKANKPNKTEKALLEWRLAIFWDNDLKGNLNLERSKLLIKRLEHELDKFPESEDEWVPRFYSSGLAAGVFKIVCVDQKSVDWLKGVVENITDLWEGCKLKIVPQAELNTLINVTMVLTNNDDELIVILKRLEKQNKGINIEKWRLHREIVEDSKRSIVLCIDEPSLDLLKKCDFKLYFGLRQVKFTLGVAKLNNTK